MNLAIDPKTRVCLCDYTWLPAVHHQAFQATLESDEGIAALHFLAEIEKMSKHGSQQRIIAVSSQAAYFCTPQADIARCVYINSIEEIFVCDEWICLCVPGEYDVLFRIAPTTDCSPTCNQNFLLEVLNGLRAHLNCAFLQPTAVSSVHALTSRRIFRPSDFKDILPLPIPVLDWGTLVVTVTHSEELIRSLLPHRALMCDKLKVSPRRNQGGSASLQKADQTKHSPSGSSGSSPRQPFTTQPQHPSSKSPKRANPSSPEKKNDVFSPAAQQRFEDPCLELVWEELMFQRKVLEKLHSHVDMLVRDRFGASAGLDPLSQSLPKERQASAPRSQVNPKVSGIPNDLDELTSFQRHLVQKFLYEEPIKKEFLSGPSARASPRDNHPSGTVFVRRIASPVKNAGTRKSVAANDFIGIGERHHRQATRQSRRHEARALASGRVVGSPSPGTRTPKSTQWLQPRR